MTRPQYKNAQSSQLLKELDAGFSAAMDDPEVRVVVLAGEGDSFSAGHDLGTPDQVAQRAARRTDVSEVEDHFDYSWQHFLDMSLRWRDLRKPTIAEVHGWCIFGGWLVASSMDLIVAADDTRFLTALLQYFTLPYDVGPRQAKALLFDNHVIGAQEACDLGFVNRVVPHDALTAETMAWAEKIADNPGFSLRMFKAAVNQAQDAMGFRVAVQSAHAHYMLSQLANTQWRRRMEREGKLPADAPAQPRSLVTKILGRDR
jgi:enoyl-CoA hydratase